MQPKGDRRTSTSVDLRWSPLPITECVERALCFNGYLLDPVGVPRTVPNANVVASVHILPLQEGTGVHARAPAIIDRSVEAAPARQTEQTRPGVFRCMPCS